ncbi:TetR/AcrR family transcriptional regulator [Kineosporia mesophila]|uniref:TetR/AcrR family transcriptional regulator n=1 Tax=Kineosporia mesophila TaxID=566012 RepID=UPI001E2EA530|nr:TetR/AcrR family transcriptional regulator [Kineosporia mesophila]
MTSPDQRSPRRSDALSRDRIVEASIEILDTAGESGLTVRAVTTHLATGRGAIYHHVTGKDELLAAAAAGIIDHVVTGTGPGDEPRKALRALALRIFEAIDAHPWVGTQLSRDPFQPAVLRIWSGVGAHLQRLGVDGPARSDAGAALVNYVLGAAAQHAAGARHATDDAARQAFLDTLATRWAQFDGEASGSASHLREHDDRQQFLAGVDIFLAGLSRPDSDASGDI